MAIVRLEQLYPLPEDALAAALDRYPRATRATWVQEEPLNVGAASFLRLRFGERLFDRTFDVVARAPSASPATGSPSAHQRERKRLLEQAFDARPP